ncbi:MAG: helix-turn-helix transcriptional regulator, partial [Clostridiales bacterium]|nr:helix-turn-helix transcriptional regulator [Clostridiales bacterium]
RKIKNMTQEKLALECEISPSYLRLIEHGIANPTINELLKIAQILGVNLQNPFPLPVLVDVV